jgi:ribosomal protein S18 acetylase RimI-like enzyme
VLVCDFRRRPLARGGTYDSSRERHENSGEVSTAVEFHYVDQEDDVLAYYPLIQQLRPHQDSERKFLLRWQQRSAQGQRLLALWHVTQLVGLAGFRVQDNLVHGRFVYMDDLVIDASCRRRGYGKILIERLKAETMLLGYAKLLLDAAMSNTLGHRFYCGSGVGRSRAGIRRAPGKPLVGTMGIRGNQTSRHRFGDSCGFTRRTGVLGSQWNAPHQPHPKPHPVDARAKKGT